MVHCTVLFELAHNRSNRRRLLSNSNVDTLNACTFLVDDCINRNRCFTYLTVTNNQLSLTSTNWHHRINCFQTNLHWLINRLTCNNTGSDFFDRISHGRFNSALTIDWITQGIDNAALKLRTNRYFENSSSTTTSLTLSELLVITENYRAHRVAL